MQTLQRRVVGRLEERGEARRQYQQAISQGKQAALAEAECDRSEPTKDAGPGWVPASPPAQAPAPDAVQDALNRVRLAQTTADWDAALQLLMEALVRLGFSLSQLDALQRLRQLLAGRSGLVPGQQASSWRQQLEVVVNALLHNTPTPRQDSFWM